MKKGKPGIAQFGAKKHPSKKTAPTPASKYLKKAVTTGRNSSGSEEPKNKGTELTLKSALDQKEIDKIFLTDGEGTEKDKKAPSITTLYGRTNAHEVEKARLKALEEKKKRRIKVIKHIHKLRERRLFGSLEIQMQSWSKAFRKEMLSPGPRYKRPIEKLMKRVKQERQDDLPPHVNIHKNRNHQRALIGGRGVRKEVELIYNVLIKYHRRVQPKVGWDYNKRQKRLLLGHRHRVLDKGWKYFQPLKGILTRRMKPNNHWPDAIFFLCNVMIFITGGFHFGLAIAAQSFQQPLEDLYEYDYFRKNKHELHIGHNFWHKVAPVELYASIHALVSGFLMFIMLLGFVGVYLADQMLHAVYFLGMLIGLITQGILGMIFLVKDYCEDFMIAVNPLLELAVADYYEKIPAIDLNGTHVSKLNAKGDLELVYIRTFSAANIMDRIQRDLLCCGVLGPEDYSNAGQRVPNSCCTPLWNMNLYCARAIPFDLLEYKAKFNTKADGSDVGCQPAYRDLCKTSERMLGETTVSLTIVQIMLFIVNCVVLVIQTRQIRQLKRVPHLRISAGTISQSLQASATDAGLKSGHGGIQAVVDAGKMSDKQAEQLQIRLDAALNLQESDEETSTSSSSSEDVPVHTINYTEMKHLQQFLDKEDKQQSEKQDLEKTVEGFAGRFNMFANKNLQNYVTGIFSTTYQNETNAGLEAINQTLENQFAQNTTDYNWRKLLHKPTNDDDKAKTFRGPTRRK